MKVVAYEGIVENGCVHLPADVRLPEKSKVYVVMPGTEAPRTVHIRSPRLVDQSADVLFKMEVTDDGADS